MIRLSYSALEQLLLCERFFQLNRLLVGAPDKQDYPATVLGKAYGAAVQSYLQHQDADKAIFTGYLNYFPVLEDDLRTEELFVSAFLSSLPILDNLLQDWELATFQNKPAVELSYRLNIDEKFYYVGYVDAILKNRWSGIHAVTEVKTTALKLHDLTPLYANSGQALGYSIVLDTIVGEDQSDYNTKYLVAQLNDKHQHKVHDFTFNKTIQDRLNWFISLGMDVNRLHEMLEMNIFPMRGSSCLQYMRPCVHFGTCSLHGLDEYKKEEEDTNEYMFTYHLEDIIANHLDRIGE